MSNRTTRVLRHLAICLASSGFLAACGGGSQDASSGQAQLLANGEACNPAWVSTTVYREPTAVSYQGINYIANFYSVGKNPASNSGATKSAGQPWLIGFTCGGTTTTTKATTTTTKATTTTTKATTTTSGATTSTTKATTTTTAATTSTTKATTTTTKAGTTTTTKTTTTTTAVAVSVYGENFNSLKAAAAWSSVNTAKIKANPTNAQVTASCGQDGTNCFKVIYRQTDGIHKAPAFTGAAVFYNNPDTGLIDWTPSDSTHTNTATDVTQANIIVSNPSKTATLTYSLYFEPGFDFAKGGKLPGLAAAAFDSGCTEDGNAKRDGSNWSVRLMWRENGRIELYSYDQSRPSGSCGVDRIIDAVDTDMKFEPPGQIPAGYENKFRFVPGTWYTITLAVKVNDNNSVTYLTDANGKLILDAFGEVQVTSGNGAETLQIGDANGNVLRTMTYSNVALRDECGGSCPASVPDSQKTWVNGLFFSTFFGGNETKRTTCLKTTPPSFPGLTQAIYDNLCTSQRIALIYPNATWNPQTYSAARFDNFKIVKGYLGQ